MSNPYHVFGMKKLVDALKSAGHPEMRVIVGGAALESVPDLYKTMGADMHLRTFEEICDLGVTFTFFVLCCQKITVSTQDDGG